MKEPRRVTLRSAAAANNHVVSENANSLSWGKKKSTQREPEAEQTLMTGTRTKNRNQTHARTANQTANCRQQSNESQVRHAAWRQCGKGTAAVNVRHSDDFYGSNSVVRNVSYRQGLVRPVQDPATAEPS